MIQVTVVRDSNGRLKSCSADGHARFDRRGSDIVCAAVTSAIRTIQSLLDEDLCVTIETNCPDRGVLAFRIKTYEETESCFLEHCSDFLIRSIQLTEQEFPENVKLRVLTES